MKAPALTLPARAVHVWLAPVPDGEGARMPVDILNTAERARRNRFRVDHARREYTAAHVLLRVVLSQYVAVPPTAWRFRTLEHGRPEIDGPSLPRPLRFNLSHTRGLVGVAVAWEVDVGLDVELTGRSTHGAAVAERYFAPSEVAALRRLPETHHREAFFRYWTLKEAYIKARGMGLALPLGKFAFSPEEAGAAPTIEVAPELNDTPEDWQFWHWPAESPEHHVALAVRAGAGGQFLPELRWKRWT